MDEKLLNTDDGEVDPRDINVYDIDQAIERAGGFGKFQVLYVTLAALCYIPNGLFVYNLSYLTLVPVLMCPTDDGDVVCKDFDIEPCSGGELKPGVYPDFSQEKSLHNWIDQMDMYCSSSFETSLFGALFFTGVLFSMTILAYTSKFGRRKNLFISSWVTFIDVLVLCFINNVYIKYLGMFILGCLLLRNISGYIVATEFSPKRLQIYVATFVLGLDVVTLPMVSFYFKFISDEWFYVAIVIAVFTFFVALGSLSIPESPRFLYDKGDVLRSRKMITRMAEMNNSDMVLNKWKFEIETNENEQYEDSQKDVNSTPKRSDDDKQLLKEESVLTDTEVEAKINPFKQMKADPKLFFNLIIVVMGWIACSFNYFLISFDIKNLGGNLFINASLITFAGLTGKFIILFIRKYVSSKISIMICFADVLIFGLGLVFFKEGWMVSTCIAFVEMGIGAAFTLSYFINTEYFPPLFLGFAFAVTQFSARGCSILSYLLADLEPPLPMILLCITTGMALLTMCFLSKPGVHS